MDSLGDATTVTPAGVDDNTMSSEGENASGTQPSTAPVVHEGKNVSNEVKEKVVRDALAKSIGGHMEWRTPSGAIDVFTENEVVEVKHYKRWKNGVGQISYGIFYPSHRKRLHLFAHNKGENASKQFQMATKVCFARIQLAPRQHFCKER